MSTYTRIREIGRGVYGAVIIGRRDNVDYAVKYISLDTTSLLESFVREATITEYICKHITSDIVNCLLESHIIAEQRMPIIAFAGELVYTLGIQSLHDAHPNLQFNTRIKFLYDLSLGLQLLHDHGIAHGDIGLRNVIVTSDMQVKLIDFGLACIDYHSLLYDLAEDEFISIRDVLLEQANTVGARNAIGAVSLQKSHLLFSRLAHLQASDIIDCYIPEDENWAFFPFHPSEFDNGELAEDDFIFLRECYNDTFQLAIAGIDLVAGKNSKFNKVTFVESLRHNTQRILATLHTMQSDFILRTLLENALLDLLGFVRIDAKLFIGQEYMGNLDTSVQLLAKYVQGAQIVY